MLEVKLIHMNSKGMTMIELIVVIVLLGIIGLFTFQFIGSSVEIYIRTINQAKLIAEARPVMERMVREIRDANSILSPVSGSSGDFINFIKSHYTTVDGTTNITFQKSGRLLERKRGMNAPEPMAEEVSSFTVTNDSNEIKLELTLSLGGGEQVVLQTKVNPKNLAFTPKDFGGTHFNGDWVEVVQ
jgi:prepilin-type N-terminal cleavage/methylation domain-containing protein